MTADPPPETDTARPRCARGRAVIHTVVAAALCREGQVLLCHRAPGRRWYPNVWDLPGGHVDRGESPQEALVRELAEELSVDVVQADVAAVPQLQVVDLELHLSVWKIDNWRGEPVNRAVDEHHEVAWLTFKEALTLPLAHSSYADLVRALAGQ